MLQLLKLEFRKIGHVYVISLAIGIIYSGIIILPYLSGYSHYNNIDIWDASGVIFCYLYPLFAVMPTCWLLYYERRNHFLAYTQNRVSKKKYILSKYLMSSIGGGFILFAMSMIGLVICLYIVPEVGSSLNPIENLISGTFQGAYYVSHPFMYGFILSLWRFVIGFLMATFGFVLSLYVKNLFIIFTFPFIYTMAEDFILSVLGMQRYMLFTSFWPGYLQAKAITYGGLLVGPLLLIVVIALTILYYAKIKKEKIYEL